VFKSNQLPGADTALCAARKAKAAFVARSGYLPSLMDAIRYGEDSAQARSARDYEARLLPQADRVVVTTAFAAEEVVQRYGVSPERVRVIPNYVETERFAPKPAAATSRFKIGCIGRLDYQKNLPALVEAVSPLDVELVLVGEGPQKAHLAELAKAARAKITLAGNLPNQDLPALLGTLDLFVLPSFYEGHPKALIEAMSCGLPVIGARVQGIRELITDELNGLLCEADAVSIRAAIQRVMEDAALAKRIGQAAREYVLSNFSLPRVVEQELALLTELA
jgi:glycosyltransferase involved in cell wall biosynthesis